MNKYPIRIAHIIGKWLGGGVEAVVMNYYRNIDRTKIQFDFICDEDSTDIPYEEINKLGGKVILIPPYQQMLKYQKELRKVLKEGNYKIIHSHINTLSVFPLYAAKKVGIPVRIAHSHSTTNKKEWKKNLLKQVLRPFSKIYATKYFCCSELAGRWLFGNKEYDKDNIYLLNNAIDLDKFKYSIKIRKEVRNELNINDNTLVFGHIGRFVEQKNHRFLIDIFYNIYKKYTNTVLVLAGQGPLLEEMKQKVKDLGIEDKVLFLGQRKDVNRLYQAMDVFLLPSLYEGLGMVLIEAQASGLMCYVSTEVPNIARVTNNLNFISLDKDADYWSNEILKKINYKRKNNTKEVSNHNYNIKLESKKLESIYIKLFRNKIKVIEIGLSNQMGGIESFLVNYSKYFNYKEFQVDYINVFDKARTEDFYFKLSSNGKIYNLPDYRKHPLKFIREFKKINDIENYDILHYNMNSACYLVPLIAGFISHIKVIISHSHNTSSDKGILKTVVHNINRHLIPLFANVYFGCSKKALEWFFNKIIVNSKDSYVINNAIDVSKFKYNKEIRKQIRDSFNINDDVVVIGHIGRFEIQKNHNFLIDVFNEYSKYNNNTILMLVGIGSLEEDIRNKVHRLGLDNKVLFLHQRNDVNNLMSAMDIFLFPSLYEGLGIVLIEAQASGLSCLVSDVIPNEAIVSKKIYKLNNKDISLWVNKIKEIDINNRDVDSKCLDYDIKKSTVRLENIFKKYIKRDDINE